MAGMVLHYAKRTSGINYSRLLIHIISVTHFMCAGRACVQPRQVVVTHIVSLFPQH